TPLSAPSTFLTRPTLCTASFPPPSGPPPDLHSFPTRRSSDLFSISAPSGRHAIGSRITPTHGVMMNCVAKVSVSSSAPSGDLRQDRKSTRLNSSHLVISYAVFCLKKKKKQKNNIDYIYHYKCD